MARKSRRLDSDMTQGSIWRQLIEFSLPMMIGLIFQQLYNTVDTIVVGQFVGKEALAAVGTTSSIINMLVGFAAGLSTGSSVIISQCYGSRDHEGLHKAVHTSISITFILAVAFTALGVLGADTLLRLQSTPEDVFPEAHTYLTIYFSGLLGLLLYNMGSGWTMMFIFQLLAFGIIMLTLGLLGAYLWRTFDAARRRPPYLIERADGEVPLDRRGLR